MSGCLALRFWPEQLSNHCDAGNMEEGYKWIIANGINQPRVVESKCALFILPSLHTVHYGACDVPSSVILSLTLVVLRLVSVSQRKPPPHCASEETKIAKRRILELHELGTLYVPTSGYAAHSKHILWCPVLLQEHHTNASCRVDVAFTHRGYIDSYELVPRGEKNLRKVRRVRAVCVPLWVPWTVRRLLGGHL
eukprot:1195602-Prorocentrum_minimum.AAC.6